MFEKEIVYFNFRLIELKDGTQVIDESVKTPMDSLTPEMQMEYMEVHEQLAFMKKMQKREHREAERRRKISRNPFRKLVYLYGIM